MNSPLRYWYAVKVPMRVEFAEAVDGRTRTGMNPFFHKLECGEIRQVFVRLDALCRKRWRVATGQRDDVGTPLRTSLHGRPCEIETLAIPGPVHAAPVRADTNRRSAAEGENINCGGVIFSLGGAPDSDEALIGRHGTESNDGVGQNLLALSPIIVHAVQIIDITLRNLKVNLP